MEKQKESIDKDQKSLIEKNNQQKSLENHSQKLLIWYDEIRKESENKKNIVYEVLDFQKPWIFNKEKYKQMLMENLPIDNFFQWCYLELLDEHEIVDLEKFYALTSLLFEN